MKTNQKKAMPLLTIGGIALILFIIEAFSVATEKNWVAKFDLRWIDAIRSHIEPAKTSVIKFLTNFGSAEYVIIMTVILVVILFILRKFVVGLWFGGTVLFCAVVLNYILKHVIGRNRPDTKNWLVSETGFSFPSGHATASTVFYGLAALFIIFMIRQLWLKLVVGFVGLVIILFMMYARIYLGVHYPTDVLGGFLFGLAAIFLSTGIYFYARKPLQGLLKKMRINDKSIV
ncbi:phosphatase PAP2 family protein [Listeria sp. PSOL-1]|uniref:phosphatase PAP2 family protein n=1 Tax=Listeria sp. PSOL-1 TaxID=1844999 RepID=UPI0013D417DA|nr:phosphatase PAP2 family protein [Listeria sp. PSOL-1]